MWDTDLVSVRQGSKPCIAHAVKIVFVPVVLLRPFGPVYYWLFLFFGGFPISEDDIGSYQFLYGVFSKSGFTPRLLDMAGQNPSLFLINEDKLIQTNT